jgi:hypothetical protein
MTALAWDKVGERFYETGIDRGVLYLKETPSRDAIAVPWNGLISVEEIPNSELKSFHLDGVKFLENLSPNDYVGKLKAFTYPDEFDLVNGIAVPFSPGLEYHDQPSKSFDLSYRTRVANDIDGMDHGYKIHLLYNIIATPDPYAFETSKDSGINPIEFSWTLTGTPPPIVGGFRPTVHLTIDSLTTPPDILRIAEMKLYGTESTEPTLPPLHEVAQFFGYRGALLIVDYGNGMWSAIDESETYITMLDDTTFQIDGADATYQDVEETEYEISSTNVG